jgi:hypothetical protein
MTTRIIPVNSDLVNLQKEMFKNPLFPAGLQDNWTFTLQVGLVDN